MRSTSLVTLVCFAFCIGIAASPLEIAEGVVCSGQATVDETFIGKDRNVKLEIASCPGLPIAPRTTLEGRQTNVCAIPCNNNCFIPAGGGPDPNECHVISDALLFESENTGAFFPVGTGTNNTVVLTFRSCKSFIVNQDPAPITFCRTNWAATLDSVAFNCQASQNAHGGNCVAIDQQYFIQVQHS